MGRGSRSLHPLFGLTLGVLVVLFASLMTASANEYIPRGQPIPTSVRWTNATATGANARVSASWTYGGTTSHHSIPVPYSSSTVGRAAAAAVRRGLPIVGWGLVLRDLVNGAGWAIDELQDQVVDGVRQDQDMAPAGTFMYRCAFAGTVFYSSSPSTLAPCLDMVMESSGNGDSSCGLYEISGGFARFYCGPIYGNQSLGGQIETTSRPEYGTGYEPSPVSFADLGQLVKAYPEIFNAIMVDPDTGAPLRTPELIDALNDLRASLEAANGVTEPGVDLTAPDDFTEGTTPSQTEWPEFCDWATTVCEFIDWVRADDTPSEQPEVEWDDTPPVQSNWSSGLGNGSCPPPVTFTISVAGGSASPEFSYEPICSFATTMRPVVIALAAIVAALIVAGVRASKDA